VNTKYPLDGIKVITEHGVIDQEFTLLSTHHTLSGRLNPHDMIIFMIKKLSLDFPEETVSIQQLHIWLIYPRKMIYEELLVQRQD
jgi:hypothetical protein